MNYIFRTIIVPKAYVPLAQALSVGISPAGAGMWTTPLVPIGSSEVTHYISSGMLGEEFVNLMPLSEAVTDEEGNVELIQVSAGHPEIVLQAATALGFKLSIEQINGLFSASDSTQQEPYAAMLRLGLEMHTEDSSIN